MSTTLTTLCADHVNTESEALGNVLGVTDHVHVEDTVCVELVNDSLGWHTDGGNEKLSTGLDDNVNELAELALGVIVAIQMSALVPASDKVCKCRILLGLSRIATNLGQQQINTERCLFVNQEALQLGDLFPQHVWGISDTTDDTETTGVGNCGGELRAGGNVHAGEDDGVVDLEEIRRNGLDLLCSEASVARSYTEGCM